MKEINSKEIALIKKALKEFFEEAINLATDRSELIISKADGRQYRVMGKESIENYYKDIAPTEAQIEAYYKEFGEDLKAMGETEPLVHISLIENEEIGFFLYGYNNIKEVPFDILLSQEYHLFCFHYKKPQDKNTLELFLKHRIANTGIKDLYWFEYKLFLEYKFNSDLPETNEALKIQFKKQTIENIQKALKYIAIIKEYIPENEFIKLCRYVSFIIENNQLPEINEKISVPIIETHKDKQGLVYLCSKLRDCTSTRKKDIWINFLQEAFKDFDLDPNTISQKFTTPGKHINAKLFKS